MNENARNRMEMIQLLANGDPEYQNMLAQMRVIEGRYDAVLRMLDNEQQNAVCDFVSQCEEMSWRMLELACLHMCFPE